MGVPLWEHLLALVLVLASIYALVRFAGRIYAKEPQEALLLRGSDLLDDQQRAAVNAPSGRDLLGNAGAGSGSSAKLSLISFPYSGACSARPFEYRSASDTVPWAGRGSSMPRS